MKFKNQAKKLFNLIVENYNKEVTLKAEVVNGRGQLYLYDVISDYWGIGAQHFVDALKGFGDIPVDLYINCPGGDVFDGRAMKNILERHSGEVVAHIDGICASAATTVACGADKRIMGEGTRFMIHNAWTLAIGNSKELTDVVGLLDQLDKDIANDYVKLTGLDESAIMQYMADETYFSAEECLENGLCDEVSNSDTSPNTEIDNKPRKQNLERLQLFARTLERTG